MHTDTSDWRHAARSTQVLALVAVLGVIAGVIGVGHFSRRVAETTGPHLMARNADGDVLFASFRTVYEVPHGGTVRAIAAEDLGLRGHVLSLSSDGSRWYLGDDTTGLIHRCDLASLHCEPAVSPPRGTRVFRRTHRVAFAADRIHVTDTTSHQIKVFDRDGNFLDATRTGPLALCFPNGIIERQGLLYVADTNNFRIARLDPADAHRSQTFLQVSVGAPVTRPNCSFDSERLGERGNALLNKSIDAATTRPRSALPPARHDRVWPSGVLNTSLDEWWVVQQDSGMRDGDVVIYAAGKPSLRVALPEGSDPVDLIELDGEVLIADPTLARVHRVSLDGRRIGAWQPPGMAAEMQRMQNRHWQAMLAKRASFGALALGVIAGIVVVFLELRRKRAEGGWPARRLMIRPPNPPAPLSAEVVWIAIDPQRLKYQRLALGIIYALPVVFLAAGLIVMLPARAVEPGTFRLVAALWLFCFVVVTAASLFTGSLARRAARVRLGVSEDRLQLDRGNGRIVSSPWADVRVNDHRLLVGRQLIEIVHPLRGSWFPWEQVYACLLPRIPPEGFMRGVQLELEALRRGSTGCWLLVALVLVMILLAINEHWMRAFGRWIAGAVA